jgi:hypothetical protein
VSDTGWVLAFAALPAAGNIAGALAAEAVPVSRAGSRWRCTPPRACCWR